MLGVFGVHTTHFHASMKFVVFTGFARCGKGRTFSRKNINASAFTFFSSERTLHWLSHQIAPTLKLALRLDKMNHTQIVHDIITHARLTEKHEKILKQQAAAAKEVVL